MGEKFRNRETQQSKNITYQTHGESTNKLHPAFCLRYLENSKYGFPKGNKDRQVIIMGDIYQMTPRNKGGKELIAQNAILRTPRMSISPDERYLSFYIGGDKGRMVGCRRDKVFYVFWFDFDFDLYDHG
jgi:hypothetical protein